MSTKQIVGISVLSCLLTLAAVVALLASSGAVIAQKPESTPSVAADSQSPERLVPHEAEFAPASAPEQPNATTATTNYQHISGSVFAPLWDTAQAVYGGSGCMYLTGSNMYLNFPLILPYNSTVTQLRLYYKDASASNGTLWLAQYNDGLDYTYVTTMTTTGNSVSASYTTVNLTHTLDYVNYSYVVLWSPAGVSGNSMQLCGFRVGYIPPGIFGVALPAVMKNSQP